MTDLERPEGWGFCWLRSCPCWESNGVACEEFVDDLGDPHPFGRCHRCGRLEGDHTPLAEHLYGDRLARNINGPGTPASAPDPASTRIGGADNVGP